MISKICISNEAKEPPADLLAVDFALVLSRMIDTVSDDPVQLRRLVYELARTKLREEMARPDGDEGMRHLRSLEAAIQGVESFAVREGHSGRPALARLANEQLQLAGQTDLNASSSMQDYLPPRFGGTQPRRFYRQSVWIVAGMLLLGGTAGGIYYGALRLAAPSLRASYPGSATAGSIPPITTLSSDDNAKSAAAVVADDLSIPIPSVYGVYAVHDRKLIELPELSEKVPDKRIAIASPTSAVPKTFLPDGRVAFVVFRRDMATFGASTADVRVIARVARVMTFDSKGKLAIAPLDGVWSIRNIAYSYRAAPMPGKPEIFVLRPEQSDFILPAGRYALSLNGQGFDFSVAGTPTDKSQCLERTDAANGSFYAQCKG